MNEIDNQNYLKINYDLELQIEEARERAFERRERQREEDYLKTGFPEGRKVQFRKAKYNPFISTKTIGFLGIDQVANSAALIDIEKNMLELSDNLSKPLTFITAINKWSRNYKIPLAVLEKPQDPDSCFECILTALQIPFVAVKSRTSFFWLKDKFGVPIATTDEESYKISLALYSFRQLTTRIQEFPHLINSIFIAKYGWENFDKLRLKVPNPFISCDFKKIEIGPSIFDETN